MKLITLISLILISCHSVSAQRNHLKQSAPFENILIAMETDSVNLFIQAFSSAVVNGNYSKELWSARLNEGKDKFEARYGIFQSSDFSYKYKRKKSKLIIFFKGEEEISMRVIKEKGVWKLNDK